MMFCAGEANGPPAVDMLKSIQPKRPKGDITTSEKKSVHKVDLLRDARFR